MVVEYKPNLKYRGAGVIAADDACDAARSLMNVRLLAKDVPLLPLKACDRPLTCKCKYRVASSMLAATAASSSASGAGGVRVTTPRGDARFPG